MKIIIRENNIKKIGCGLDKLKWNKVKEILFLMYFKNIDVEILVCYL